MAKKIVVVSGYFNPIHGGHLDNITEAKKLGDELWVIVNNDKQQIMKKGKIIMNENERISIVKALRYVDNAILSVDSGISQCETLKQIAEQNKGNEIIFAKGGDRTLDNIPEVPICDKYGIKMVFGVGGKKTNSSSNINKLLGRE